MSDDTLSYNELKVRLTKAEAALESLRRGEVDLVIGTGEPLVVRVKSLVEEVERLGREWQTTFDSISDAVWVLDAEQRVLRSNRAAERIFQRPVAEMTGKHYWEIVHGTQEPIPQCPMLRMRKSLRRESMELQVGERWLEVTVDPILDENNGFSGAVYSVSDITERKQAEDALHRSENLFKNLFQHHAAVKLIIDPDTGRIVDANRAAVDFYGWPREQFLQMRIQEINTAQPEEIAEALEQVINRKQTRFEFRHRRSDGSVRDVEVFSSRIESDGKSLLHSIVHDITKRKRSEAEVRRLTMAIEQTGDVVMVTDPEGTIQYVNPAFESVTGYTRLEAIGQPPRLLKSGKHDQSFYRNMWETITGGRVWQGRMVNKRKDGTLYTEETTISPVKDGSGRIVNFVAVKRDITENLLLESQLQQAQKMESVGRLAGGVAHDFNNMLSVIIGNAELALKKTAADDPLHKYLKEILNAAGRSAGITRQLLSFARKETIAPKVLDLNAVIENMLKMLRRLIGEDMDLSWLPGPGLWPANMDPSQIDQLLANLCINARDAITDVGKITIETKNVIFDEDYCAIHAGFSPGEYVMLSVSDNGCGMDRETQENIFEPFFTTKEVGKGTGLGLATVYGIVKQNNGFINVYSEPGQGTIFKIYLPRQAGAGAATERGKTVEKPLKGGGETVLVVEDEMPILTLIEEILTTLNYKVLTANTPSRALQTAETHAGEIALLITDVVMPEMNGRDLAQHLKTHYPALKVLFMSGYTANVIADKGVLDKEVKFIQKPFSNQDLSAKVRAVLDRE